MKQKHKKLGLGGVALAAALLAMPPVLDAIGGLNTGATVFAKGGNGGGNDGGNGGHSEDHGGGNHGGNGHGGNGHGGGYSGDYGGYSGNDGGDYGGYSGHREDHRDTSLADQEKQDDKAGKSLHQDNHGAIASALGSLNAGHASETARQHAAPDSRVGLLAQYKEAVLDGRALSADIATLTDELNTLQAQRDGLDTVDTNELNNEIADLQKQIDTLDKTSASYDQDLADLSGQLKEKQQELAAAEEQNAKANTLDQQIAQLEDDLKIDQQKLDEANQTAESSLSAAANKDTNDQVVAELNNLLGIPPESDDDTVTP